MSFALMLALASIGGQKADDAPARPFLHPLFTDHAVVQRDAPVPFSGWTEPGLRVKVAMAGQSVETTADDRGRWVARLGPYPAGGPHVATVTGGEKTVEVKDLLVGDVWLCSGQSNMEWPVNRSDRADAEIAAADHPRIRLLTVPKKIAFEPLATFEAAWEVCGPATVPDFSAVGYFFGRDLEKDLNVPIGLIDSTWGGTVAEAWTSVEALKTLGDFDRGLARLASDKAERDKPPVRFEQALAAWWKKSDPGVAGEITWADPKFDASGWKTMELPGNWEDRGLPDYDGIVWFRKEVELSREWVDGKTTLNLGALDDYDTTFVNGVEVGHMEQWDTHRKYRIPAGLLQPGKNLIAVRILDSQGNGGFAGPKGEMKLSQTGPDSAGPSIPLAGPWLYKEAARAGDLTSPPGPSGQNPNVLAALYHGMIAPLAPSPIKGVIWYQGEGNAGRPEQYRRLLPTLIRDWRARFECGDFPFLIVQLANHMERRNRPSDSNWAELREAQFLTTKAVPNAALALAIDIGDARDIHPTNKQEVGRRLALAALALTYGKPVEPSGPVYKGMEIQENAIRLSFDHVGGGLVVRGGGKLEGFAIAGEDGKFVWADATIDGLTVVVTSPEVPKPTRVRYAWADNPACNLDNNAGLPAVPFRTDRAAK